MSIVRIGKIKERPSRLLIGLLLASFVAPGGFAAKPDKNHQDCFVPGPPDEARIAKEVRHQLLVLPYYGVFDDLAFKIEGNTVTLVGATANPVLKSDAANAVKRIEGVETVNNQIELLPVSPFDDQIGGRSTTPFTEIPAFPPGMQSGPFRRFTSS